MVPNRAKHHNYLRETNTPDLCYILLVYAFFQVGMHSFLHAFRWSISLLAHAYTVINVAGNLGNRSTSESVTKYIFKVCIYSVVSSIKKSGRYPLASEQSSIIRNVSQWRKGEEKEEIFSKKNKWWGSKSKRKQQDYGIVRLICRHCVLSGKEIVVKNAKMGK